MSTTTAAPAVRFMKYFITDGTVRAGVRYSLDNRIDGRKCVTLYAKTYMDNLFHFFPDDAKNDTDICSDYHEKDRVVLFEDHPMYAAARTSAEAEKRNW